MNKPLKTYITLIFLLGLLLPAGCRSVVLQQPAAVVELPTPTPEVFNNTHAYVNDIFSDAVYLFAHSCHAPAFPVQPGWSSILIDIR